MKWLTCVVFLCVLGCKSDPIPRNPYLDNLPPFEFELSLDLPLYDGLRFAGGYITIEQLGLNGVHLYNLDGSQILAWEASCPNQRPSDCSKTTINDIIVQSFPQSVLMTFFSYWWVLLCKSTKSLITFWCM